MRKHPHKIDKMETDLNISFALAAKQRPAPLDFNSFVVYNVWGLRGCSSCETSKTLKNGRTVDSRLDRWVCFDCLPKTIDIRQPCSRPNINWSELSLEEKKAFYINVPKPKASKNS